MFNPASKFPAEYFELFKKAIAEPPVIITLPDKRTAQRVRFSLHGFRRALIAKFPEADPELTLLIETVQVRLKKNESDYSLIIEPRERTGLQFVQAALKTE